MLMKQMEITPRRTLSLNFDSKTYYFDKLSPIKNMWTEQNLKSGIETPTSGYKMSHSLSMDDTRVNQNFQKKNNNILKSMIGIFGSLTNIVSRIPNFMSSINNPLSVTVVSNEGLISPEDLLKNLTRSTVQQDKPTVNDSIKLFDRMQESNMYNTKSNIAEIYAEKIASTPAPPSYLDVANHLLPKSWIDGFNDQQESFATFDESNDLNLAIEESLRHMKLQKNWTDEEIENQSVVEDNIEDKPQFNLQTEDIDDKDFNEISKNIDSSERMDSPESEIPSKRPHLQKTKRKTNTVARSRGKSRSKFQLRKSGVSQSKHRKERTKHNLYSSIQDDLEAWEEDNDEDEMNYCKIEFNCPSHKPDYPTFIESLGMDNPPRIKKRRQRKLSDSDCLKLSYRVRFLPDCSKAEDELLSPIPYDIRQRLPSESSIDSEDSCIVFEDCSETGCTEESDDYDDTSDDDIDEEDKPGQKVRFNLEPKVHTMIQWNYAYRAARRGPWEEMARDRERFRGRINCIGRVIDPVLTAKHRECIWHDRFAVDESIKNIGI